MDVMFYVDQYIEANKKSIDAIVVAAAVAALDGDGDGDVAAVVSVVRFF